MSAEEIRARTQKVWDRFYGWGPVWSRSSVVSSIRFRLAFVLVSKLYRQMYANTGIATDSARINRSATWARMIAKPCQKLFAAAGTPDIVMVNAGVAESLGGALGRWLVGLAQRDHVGDEHPPAVLVELDHGIALVGRRDGSGAIVRVTDATA